MNPITKEGEVLLREELKKLKSEDRPRIIDAISTAREFGDLKEGLSAAQKKLPPALQKAIKDKQDKKEVKEESEEEKEEVKSLRDTVHDIWNQAANEEETREDKAKYYKPVEEEKKSLNEEKIKCPNCGHMNDAGADKCSNCGYDLSKKEGKHEKKKTMTGSPATKVDVKPEVDFDGK